MGAKLRNYQDRLTAALGSGDLPAVGVGRVAVHHDRKCRIFRGGRATACRISQSTSATVMWLLSARMDRSAG